MLMSPELDAALNRAERAAASNPNSKDLSFSLALPYLQSFLASHDKTPNRTEHFRNLARILSRVPTTSLQRILTDHPALLECVLQEVPVYATDGVWEASCRLLVLFVEAIGVDQARLAPSTLAEMALSFGVLGSVTRDTRDVCVLLLRLALACAASAQVLPVAVLARAVRASAAVLDAFPSPTSSQRALVFGAYATYFKHATTLLGKMASNAEAYVGRANSLNFAALEQMHVVPLIRSMIATSSFRSTLRHPLLVEQILAVGDALSRISIEVSGAARLPFVDSLYVELHSTLRHVNTSVKEFGTPVDVAASQYLPYLPSLCMCPHLSVRSSARSLVFMLINESGLLREKTSIAVLNAHAALLKSLRSKCRTLPREDCPINEFSRILQTYTKEAEGRIAYINNAISATLDALYQSPAWLSSSARAAEEKRPLVSVAISAASKPGNALRKQLGALKRGAISYDSRTSKVPRAEREEEEEEEGDGGEAYEGAPLDEKGDDDARLPVRVRAPVSKGRSVADLLRDSSEAAPPPAPAAASVAPDVLAAYAPAASPEGPAGMEEVPMEGLFASLVALSLADLNRGPDEAALEAVPTRFRDQDHYTSTFAPLLLDELRSGLQSELRGNSAQPARSAPSGSLALTCESSSVLSEELRLAEVVLVVPHDGGAGRRALGAQKDDLLVLVPAGSAAHSARDAIGERHCLAVVSSGLRRDPKEKHLFVASALVLVDSLATGSEYRALPLTSLTTFLREWAAVHSVGPMPLASYLLKASPVASAAYLSKLQHHLQIKVQSLRNLVKDARNQKQLSLMQDAIAADLLELSRVAVDGSVLKSSGMGKFVAQLKSNELLSSASAELCRDVVLSWKEQVKRDHSTSTLGALRGGCLVPLPPRLDPPPYLSPALWVALAEEHNASQLLAIKHVCQPLTATNDTRISLVQGPPGTGKTKTIIGIVAGLLSARLTEQRRGRRLLVCAASNSAVDEMLLRLLLGVRDEGGVLRAASVVRLGKPSEDADQRVRDSTLDSLVEAVVRRDPKYQQLEATQLSVRQIQQQLDEAAADQNQQQLKYQLGALRRSRAAQEAALDKLRAEVAKTLLSGADIVVATLSSSAQQQFVEHMVAFKVTFDAVICDEAAQSTEPSVLIPLRYGCRQLVLVGDPRQLPPTVVSERAARAGLSVSLFERLERAGHEVLMLSIQYRMHPEIRRFPSSYFYHDKLVDGDGFKPLALRGAFASFRPVTFIDLSRSQEEKQKTSFSNEAEAEHVVALLREVLLHVPGNQVAVIAPYKAQVKLIKTHMRKLEGVEVEVNSVDGFQGREKSVIVFSCVRTSRNIGFLADERRLNVALTRAKHALVIVGRASAFSHDGAGVWRDLVSSLRSRDCVHRVDSDEVDTDALFVRGA